MMLCLKPKPETLPANAWSIDSGVAALIVEPWTRDVAQAEKRAILGAKRVRIFVDDRVGPGLSRPKPEPIKFEHYPLATLRWCATLATSILPSVFDCRKSSRSEELEALLQKFDTPDKEDEFCIMHLLTDSLSHGAVPLVRVRPVAVLRAPRRAACFSSMKSVIL
jgi:hypothetical protein